MEANQRYRFGFNQFFVFKMLFCMLLSFRVRSTDLIDMCEIEEIELLANYCRDHLPLQDATLSDEYYYKSLPLCVIDAVYSIGIRYTTTRNVVINFCNELNITRLRNHGEPHPPIDEQLCIQSLLNLYEENGVDEMTERYFDCRNRTSARNGILKSEAVFRFSRVLNDYGVNYFQNVPAVINNEAFENSIMDIPGQKSGLSLRYFYMLSGEDNFIKADRMITRFIDSAIGRVLNPDEATSCIMQTHELLLNDFPELTPRELDHEIWKYQKKI